MNQLLETPSISFVDLAETFLICPTCLCHFDRSQRRPKLLVCSHSFCLICINEMVKMPQSRQTGSFCCPVCRQPIVIPIDGADGFPPSFMVNQLIDLISTQPKQAISKCPTHLKELLFCEDCDRVFCPQCAAPPDHQAPLDCGVSVMPLSLATKKFSAILTLKAHNSIRTLIEADRNVCKELSQLERNMNTTKEQIFGYFKDLAVLLQERQENLLDDLRSIYLRKRNCLKEQLGLVEREKLEIERQFSPAIQVDVSPISHLLSEIDRRWEESLNLVEPTENGHLWFEHSQTVSLASVKKTIETLGVIGTSETFPPLCTATVIQPVLAHMANRILISSVDQQGKPCRIGGDQIEILLFAETENTGRLRLDSGELLLRIADLENGNYTAILPALQPGKYHLEIRILGRCIKNGRITFDLSPHIDCIRQWGCSLSQPVRVLAGADKDILILDTGNDRLVVFGDGIQRLRYIEGPAIWGKSTVGMTFSPQCQSIFTLNWRDKRITKWSYEGSTLCYSECESGSDPVDLCFDRRRDRVIVADNNASGHMIVYSGTDLALLNSVPLEIVNCRGPMGISCISAGLNEDVIVGGRNEVRIYTFEGKFLRFVDFWPYDRIQRPRNPVKTVRNSMSVAIVGGVVCDGDGLILTSVISCIDSQNKSSGCVASFISVSSYDGHLKFHIDSDTSRLKRPNGIGLRAVSDVGLCYVADLALNQIFTYRYK